MIEKKYLVIIANFHQLHKMQLQPTKERQSEINSAWGYFARFVYHFIDLILICWVFFSSSQYFHSQIMYTCWLGFTEKKKRKKKQTASCHKLSVLSCADKCSCSEFSQLDFWQIHTQTQKQHLCIRFLTAAEERSERDTEQEAKTHMIQVLIHTILCMNWYK